LTSTENIPSFKSLTPSSSQFLRIKSIKTIIKELKTKLLLRTIFLKIFSVLNLIQPRKNSKRKPTSPKDPFSVSLVFDLESSKTQSPKNQ